MLQTHAVFQEQRKTVCIFLILLSLIYPCHCVTQTASYICDSDPTNANNIVVTFRVLPNSDTIFGIFAYDASKSDTSTLANRMDACTATTLLSAITVPTTEPVEFVVTVDTTSTAAHECGVALTGSTVKVVWLLFRSVAYQNLVSDDDVIYQFSCSSDDLNGQNVSTPGLSQSPSPPVTLLQPIRGLQMAVHDNGTDFPVSVVNIGDPVYITFDFNPGQQKGHDNWGKHFFVGFLGNDVISGASQSSLFLILQPRYETDTYITVTSFDGTEEVIVSAPKSARVNISSDLMGCSDLGEAELADKGVEITASHEIGVLVINTEINTSGVYTALPVDVLGMEYYTVAVPTVEDASEFMVIATEDDTVVNVTVPAYTYLSLYANVSKGPGETLSINMKKRQALHIAQTSDELITKDSITGYHVTSTRPVSVISGNRKFSNDHVVEQIPPTTKLGYHYVLIPVDLDSDGRSTTYYIQAVKSGTTTVKQYTGSSTFDTHTIVGNTQAPLTITVTTDPCELEADKPIQVTQVVQPNETADVFESAMLVMPSVQQWSDRYLVATPFRTKMLIVFPSEAVANTFKMDGFGIVPSGLTDVKGPHGYVFYSFVWLTGSVGTDKLLEVKNAITLFMVMAYYYETGVGMGSLPVGYRYPTTGECDPTPRQGDLFDNDCDGLFDEELRNFLDDDADGKIDEDTVLDAIEYLDAVNIRMFNCKVSGTSDFSDPSKIAEITGSDGCSSTGDGPFKQNGECVLVSGTGIERKLFKCGEFEIAMFEDSSKLYFMCDVKFCSNSSDTECQVICSPEQGRRKRQAVEDESKTVQTDVWVVPPAIIIEDQGPDDEAQLAACLEITAIKLVGSLLISLSLISFLTAVCFCCMFRRNREQQKSIKRLKERPFW